MQNEKRPFTVEDHKELGRRHMERKINAVNNALGFPTGDAFEEDLDVVLNSDAEANGEVVAIALIDCDKFDHINKDFSCEEGDRVLIAAGRYISIARFGSVSNSSAYGPVYNSTRSAPVRKAYSTISGFGSTKILTRIR